MHIRAGDAAVITGAASGIGRATALALAKKGCSLVLGDLDGGGAERVATLAHERYGVRAYGKECDVRADEAVERPFGLAQHEFGRFDIAVLNAGIGYYARIEETPAADLAQLFDINVLGVQRGVLAAVPVMRARGRGAIAITGSVNGKIAWPYHGAYSATKFALTGLAQALRMELGGSGVTCTLVLPANARTGFYSAARANDYDPAPIGATVSAGQVARGVVNGIERGAAEVYVGPPFIGVASRFGMLLPGVSDRAGRRWGRRKDSGAS